MARSLKKGPYVFERLLKRVQELNKNNNYYYFPCKIIYNNI